MCGALKVCTVSQWCKISETFVYFSKQKFQNIVGCAAGFVDGLGMGDNTKAAVIRLGLMEMVRFAQVNGIFCNKKL